MGTREDSFGQKAFQKPPKKVATVYFDVFFGHKRGITLGESNAAIPVST